MNAGVGPVLFPVVEIGLGFLQALEAQPFHRRPLRVVHSRLDFAFAIGIAHPAGHGHGPVVRQDVAIERIQGGVVKRPGPALPEVGRRSKNPVRGEFIWPVLRWQQMAVDKSEGVVKDKNVLSGVCDTACSPEKVEDQDSGISR